MRKWVMVGRVYLWKGNTSVKGAITPEKIDLRLVARNRETVCGVASIC